jgi:aminopeptidase N
VIGPRVIACCAPLLALAWPATAERLPADVKPLHYQLVVKPDFETATFDGDLVIDLQVDKATSRVTLNAVDLEVYRAEARLPAGRTLHPAITADAVTQTVSFVMPSRLFPGTLKLHVEYGGRLRSDGRGFYLARAYGRKYALSRLEATGARRAFPCFDEPAFTASFAVSAVVSDRVAAISNGKLLSDTPGPDSGEHTLRFATTPRMSSYLVALAIGEFRCLERTVEGMPIRACAAPEKQDLGRFVLDVAEQAFLADSRYFTLRYPFRKLDVVAVPAGYADSSGNAGAIFFDDRLLSDPTLASEPALARLAEAVSHGVAHQWLGSVVTFGWWDDLWISEGLAEWLATKPLLAWRPQWHLDLSNLARTNGAMRLDSMPSARAVRTAVTTEAEAEESVDNAASAKAAAVLRMVEASSGEEAVRAGINAFVRARAYEPATGDEVWGQLARATGDAVDRMMRPAITTPGVPVVDLDSSCDGAETLVTVSQRRFSAGQASPPAGPDTWQIPLAIRGVGVDAPMLISTPRTLSGPRQTFRLTGCFPSVIVNAGATGYFYTAYTAGALARLAPLARDRMTPAERIRLLDDAWATATTGALGIAGYLTLVTALASDPTPEVIEEIAVGLTDVREYLLPDRGRAPFEAWVTRTFGPVAAGLGWRVAPGESADRQRLRAAVLEIAGGVAHDRDVLATARTLAAARIAGAEALGPSLAAAVIGLAARGADADLLASLESLDALGTVARASDPAFVTGALDRALADPDRHGRVASLLAAALQNPAVGAQAWQFLTSRWSDLAPAVAAPSALASVVAATGSFCDGSTRNEVAQFFGERAVATPRTLRLALDRIDACRDRRLRLETPVVEWLDNHR